MMLQSRYVTLAFLVALIQVPMLAIAEELNALQVLVYETDEVKENSPVTVLVEQLNRLDDVSATIFGQGKKFEGFGSKFSAVVPALEELEADDLVVISDSRDVLINNPGNNNAFSSFAVADFREAFEEVTKTAPGAIVISAEAQCCVSALTHVAPGDYYNEDGSRNMHSCSSGEQGCLWNGDDFALPWEAFMKELSIDRTGKDYEDVYLNAGLIAGKAGDILRVVKLAAIKEDEDDQAVLTDFMYNNPDSIVLDYGQQLFGNNRGGISDEDEDKCAFSMPKGQTENTRLVHSKTQSSPLFIHSPGGFWECHDKLAEELGVKAVARIKRRLRQTQEVGCNYRRICRDGIFGGNRGNNGDDEDDQNGIVGGVLDRLGNGEGLFGNRNNNDEGNEGLFSGGGNGILSGLRNRAGGRGGD